MFRNIFCICMLMFFSSAALSSIVMNNTRVIYPESAREVTVALTNLSPNPVLVQSWLDSGNPQADPTSMHTPFLVIPPITRVESNSANTLRVIAISPATLPRNKESVFWLNVLDIPVKAATGNQNHLQVALQSRIKVFYRPPGLPGRSEDAPSELAWRSTANGLVVSNPTAWYVSLAAVTAKGESWPLEMVAPGEHREFAIPLKPGSAMQVAWIDDNGTTQVYDAVTK